MPSHDNPAVDACYRTARAITHATRLSGHAVSVSLRLAGGVTVWALAAFRGDLGLAVAALLLVGVAVLPLRDPVNPAALWWFAVMFWASAIWTLVGLFTQPLLAAYGAAAWVWTVGVFADLDATQPRP